MSFIKAIILLFLTVLPTTLRADVHKCIDRAGAVTYTSEGCPNTSKKKLVVGERPVVKYTGEKITLNFYEVDLRSAFQVLADFTGLKMIMLPGVYGNATIAVTDRPWDEVFAYLISKYNLTWRRSHDVIYIGKEWDFK